MTITNIHFDSILINGYRGRHFELKMNPPGENTVFVMDGNTGKTTTIALLRWCFNYSQSEAEGKFAHMWAHDAHVLDWNITGSQKASISISFSSEGHDYTFTRITSGEFVWESEKEKIGGDIIIKIEDVLEIDKGADVKKGDEAHEYLRMNFRLHECADYFCFDGEQARKFLILASDKEQIQKLIETVDRRVSHPRISKFKEKLVNLENRVYDEVKKETASNASSVTIKRTLNGIKNIQREITHHTQIRSGLENERSSLNTAIKKLEMGIDDRNKEIEDSKSKKLLEQVRIEGDIEKVRREIERERREVYKNPEWVMLDITDTISRIKLQVKEKGRLPEPYRRDLIEECLSSIPKTCQICGRKLDTQSEEHVKSLGKLVASHPVQEFLSNPFKMEVKSFDHKNKSLKIKKKIESLDRLIINLNNINLTELEKKLIEERDKLLEEKIDLENKLMEIQLKLKGEEGRIKERKDELEKLKKKSEKLQEYRIIFEKIKETTAIIETTEQKTKEKTREIISETISNSVSSILGTRFSARLTSKHLFLGENGKYHQEIGGMSGRLILSYCFAEAMTLVDPMIIDTPSGNIGGVREKLAEHLKANHRQVILLCLPTELEMFAPIISKKTITIENKRSK